jgi:hypothetical protein
MTPTQLFRLAIVVIVGLLWIGLGQDLLFQNLLADLFAGPGVTLGTLFQNAVNPAFQALWVSCMIGALIWFWMTYKTRPSGAQQAVTIGSRWWWTIALVNLFLGWALMAGFLHNEPIPASGWLTLLIFVVIDVVICFWLPTLMATPRTFRLVVPGAVNFLGDR